MADVNAHADLDRLLQRARDLQSWPPEKARLGRAIEEGALDPNDVRWVYLAAELIEAVVAQLEPGALRSAADLPDEPPLFTTRRLFQALEERVERLERAVTLAVARDEIRIDTFSNGRDQAVRVTHMPTGTVTTGENRHEALARCRALVAEKAQAARDD